MSSRVKLRKLTIKILLSSDILILHSITRSLFCELFLIFRLRRRKSLRSLVIIYYINRRSHRVTSETEVWFKCKLFFWTNFRTCNLFIDCKTTSGLLRLYFWRSIDHNQSWFAFIMIISLCYYILWIRLKRILSLRWHIFDRYVDFSSLNCSSIHLSWELSSLRPRFLSVDFGITLHLKLSLTVGTDLISFLVKVLHVELWLIIIAKRICIIIKVRSLIQLSHPFFLRILAGAITLLPLTLKPSIQHFKLALNVISLLGALNRV